MNSTGLSLSLDIPFQMQFPSWARRFDIWLVYPPTCALRPINPDNARGLCITATAGTELVTPYSLSKLNNCSSIKTVYNPRAFILYAASLHQTFVHCGIFSTAASRRSLDSVSVPMLGAMLSHPLPVIALVSYYLTNKLIGRRLIPKR